MILSLPCLAAVDEYKFTTSQEKQRFEELTGELRCLVCQNQNLAESNSSFAIDLRDKIYQKILGGQSNKQIIDFLTARYGDFILYRPPLNSSTAGLWLGPYIMLISGLCYLFLYLYKRQQ
jgi:cytochrome c-type biogenesis protein CcmH